VNDEGSGPGAICRYLPSAGRPRLAKAVFSTSRVTAGLDT
jgi:hypothetical protein